MIEFFIIFNYKVSTLNKEIVLASIWAAVLTLLQPFPTLYRIEVYILRSSSPRMPWSINIQLHPDFLVKLWISSVPPPHFQYVLPYRWPCTSPEPLSAMQEMPKQMSFKLQFANSSLFAAYCVFLNNAQINFSTMEIINTRSKPGVSSRAQIKSCGNPTAGACLIISLFFDVLFSQVS